MKTVVDHPGAYFAEPCPGLARVLDEACDSIAADAELAARAGVPVGGIVLGGGYGRGEGGLWRESSGGTVRLHNDLDFFLFTDRPNDLRLRAWVAAEEELWTERLGVHVDFACLPPRALDGVRRSMMLTDLVLGYRPVFGHTEFIDAAARKVDPGRLPLWEATRLLWNRGTGLYFARCRIAERSEPEFVERNQQKLALSLGDALLCLAGEHHSQVVTRQRRFAELSPSHFGLGDGESGERLIHRLRLAYDQAVAFKLRPASVDVDWSRWLRRDAEMTALWSTVFLRVESARLGRDHATLADYAGERRRLVPESARLKNLLIALRDRRATGGYLKPASDYPRGALLRCLAAIHAGDVEMADRCLPQSTADSGDLEVRYREWWQRYQ